jgi:hypothetical protein
MAISSRIESSLADTSMTEIDKKQIWQMTAFQCRCNRENICLKSFGSCNLCQTCSCLIFCNDIPHVTICPVCRVNESWEIIGFSCLAC